MILYNGYTPNEARTQKVQARVSDRGHSIIEFKTRRRGDDFRFVYTARCQCGRVFSSRQSSARVGYAHEAHKRAVS